MVLQPIPKSTWVIDVVAQGRHQKPKALRRQKEIWPISTSNLYFFYKNKYDEMINDV